KSTSEEFSVIDSNLNPATMIMVRGKAGNAQQTYNFLLSQTCGTPTPTRRIYWTNVVTDTIGRANLDGQNVNRTFIGTARSPFGMAVDRSHMYWANSRDKTIGRGVLAGQKVNQSFIRGASYPDWWGVGGGYTY